MVIVQTGRWSNTYGRSWNASGQRFRGTAHRVLRSRLRVQDRRVADPGESADWGGLIHGRVPWPAQRASSRVLTPAQLATPLAQRPYDLRHACLSLWLNGGVPAANVAARAGHSVAMLQSTYAHCIDGDEEIMNRRIDAALGAPPTPAAEHAEQTAAPLPHPRTRVPRSFREYRLLTAHSGSRRHTREAPETPPGAGEGGSREVDEPSSGEGARCLHSAGWSDQEDE